MNDSIRKYFYEDDTKITLVKVDEVCNKVAEMQKISRKGDFLAICNVICFSAALSSQIKQSDSYITIKIKNAHTGIAYSATAFGDGRVCGFTEKTSEEITQQKNRSFILEAVRKSDMGGEYKSVVMGNSMHGAINAYISESMQRSAKWKCVRIGTTTVGVFAEDIPGTHKLNSAWKHVSKYLSSSDENIFESDKFRILEEEPLSFGCKCTKRSVKRVLASLPEEERLSLGKTTEVVCKFCGKKYVIEND